LRVLILSVLFALETTSSPESITRQFWIIFFHGFMVYDSATRVLGFLALPALYAVPEVALNEPVEVHLHDVVLLHLDFVFRSWM
jgi:hypothetical protein